jgi:hypothetical protein
MTHVPKVFAALVLISLSLCVMQPMAGAQPTVQTPASKTVKGSGTLIDTTIKVTSHENATYKVKVKEIENVTIRFDLTNHGNSESHVLAPGESYNFSVSMTTKTASVGQKTKVPFEVYENDVLVYNGMFNVTVEPAKVQNPSNVDCSTCGLIIPMIIVGSVYIVFQKRRSKEE